MPEEVRFSEAMLPVGLVGLVGLVGGEGSWPTVGGAEKTWRGLDGRVFLVCG